MSTITPKMNNTQNIPNDNTPISLVSPSSIFIYVLVFCTCIIYFRSIDMSLGIIFGIFVAAVCVYVLYWHEITNMTNTEQLHKIKADNIKPMPKYISKYTDFTDFIFSIQDFYIYNPQSYENIIKDLDTFIEIYEYVLIDNSLAGDYYSIAEARKLLALNSLHSVIMMIPSDKKIINKLNDALKTFEQLLNKYLLVIYEKNEKYIKDKGYFNNTKLIELNIAPYNKYKNETYDQYY